ncbi:uncharacterized protein TNCV_3104461 [Trichonephila clavipes]|nr:uncharacterized protein TNCV_3104461 [Trichonephila clavipes]
MATLQMYSCVFRIEYDEETDLVESLQDSILWDDIKIGSGNNVVAAVAEWYRYRIMAWLVTSSSPIPLKTRCVGQQCTLNLSRAETTSRWCSVVVGRGGASSGVVHVT